MNTMPSWISALDWRLYLVLDPSLCHETQSWFDVARAALNAGVQVIQLRDKTSNSRVLIERANALASLCQLYGACFIVNDRVDVALAVGANGVHLGPNDMPVEDARRIAPGILVGGSARSVESAQALERQGAHYIGCGAIFEARSSKPDASAPAGLGLISSVSELVSIPIVGIGGITATTAPAVLSAGATGVAVIRAIAGQPEPQEAVQLFWDSFSDHMANSLPLGSVK